MRCYRQLRVCGHSIRNSTSSIIPTLQGRVIRTRRLAWNQGSALRGWSLVVAPIFILRGFDAQNALGACRALTWYRCWWRSQLPGHSSRKLHRKYQNMSNSLLFLLSWRGYRAVNLNCLRPWASRGCRSRSGIYCYIPIHVSTVCGMCRCRTKSQCRDDPPRWCWCFLRAKYHPAVDQDEHWVGINLSNDTHRDFVIGWKIRREC